MPRTAPSQSVTGRPLMRYCNITWAAYSVVASGLTVTTKDVIRSAAFMAEPLVCWKIIGRYEAGIDPDQFGIPVDAGAWPEDRRRNDRRRMEHEHGMKARDVMNSAVVAV